MQIQIDAAWKAACPGAALGCLLSRVKVEKDCPGLQKEMEHSLEEIAGNLRREEIASLPRIRDTREGYRAAGKDPHRYRSSCEAMLRRITSGKGLYRINNVVDCNNIVSVESGFSLGTYDTAQLTGGVVWQIAPEGTRYPGIGKEEINVGLLPALRDDMGFFGNPSSDSIRAMIRTESREVLLVIYSFGGTDGLETALCRAESLFSAYCGAEKMRRWIITNND